MKIINIENEEKKVYVQLNDIMMLMQFGSTIPAEVMDKVFSDIFIVTDDNRFEFKEFVEPHTVEFFEKCDWIPDFREYKNMTEEEIINGGQNIAEEMNEIAVKLNTLEDKNNDEDLLTKYESLKFKMHSTAEILWTKQGHRIMPFPIVPDYKGVEYKDNIYIAQQGLNPLQLLVSRIDGENIEKKVPSEFMQNAVGLLVDDNLEHNEFFGDVFKRDREISDDGKYLVITFKIVPLEHYEKENNLEVKKQESPLAKKKSIGSRIKNWFNKRK